MVSEPHTDIAVSYRALNRDSLPPGEYERIIKQHAKLYDALRYGDRRSNIELSESIGLDYLRAVRAMREDLDKAKAGLTVVAEHIKGPLWEFYLADDSVRSDYRVFADVTEAGQTVSERRSIIVKAMSAKNAKNVAQHKFVKVCNMEAVQA